MTFYQTHFNDFDFQEEIKETNRDWKGELQTISQNHCGNPPRYDLTEESGPPHRKKFVFKVYIGIHYMG